MDVGKKGTLLLKDIFQSLYHRADIFFSNLNVSAVNELAPLFLEVPQFWISCCDSMSGSEVGRVAKNSSRSIVALQKYDSRRSKT